MTFWVKQNGKKIGVAWQGALGWHFVVVTGRNAGHGGEAQNGRLAAMRIKEIANVR